MIHTFSTVPKIHTVLTPTPFIHDKLTWNRPSSPSTFSRDFFFVAAENKACAYRPSMPNTWMGGYGEQTYTRNR